MSDTVISVHNLGKRYKIGGQQPYRTLREKLDDKAVAPFRAARHLFTRNGNGTTRRNSKSETIWALKDVSFDVRRGEVVGIIGRNGAGKSTLLKILSRITEPTEGYADITGRIASLLEVGTGFHPELTGRENIFLNGSILGMRRTEIQSKFDEIVAFAEIEKFIDTPVKHYSSGMYVRLAFAVAAHLDPEILLVDEVLAVGDAAFQKKCLGKMGDVAKEGRTVLFVSHNMAAMRRLCERGIYLDQGVMKSDGRIDSVTNEYLINTAANSQNSGSFEEVREGEAKYVSWEIINSPTGSPHTCYSRDKCVLKFVLCCKRTVRRARLGFELTDFNDQKLLVAHSSDHGGEEVDLFPGDYEVYWNLRLPLKEGMYTLTTGLGTEIEGQLHLWTAKPLLSILPKAHLHLPPEKQGVISEDIQVEIRPAPAQVI
jgi:ABC-type polysaccharide/polyol phosphate transport system ATPase subunit